MGWERNHYDRFIHFLFGLLLAYPMREIFFRVADAHGFWSYFLPLDLTMSTSMLFELFEWWVVLVFGGDLGQDYIGTQGDPWDAHKDMLLASCGAFISMLITLAVNWKTQTDFAREWSQSLHVKRWRPLGEDELARRRHRKEAGQPPNSSDGSDIQLHSQESRHPQTHGTATRDRPPCRPTIKHSHQIPATEPCHELLGALDPPH